MLRFGSKSTEDKFSDAKVELSFIKASFIRAKILTHNKIVEVLGCFFAILLRLFLLFIAFYNCEKIKEILLCF